MKRRRYIPIVVLVMLLASLFSTETAEVWCRLAVGATVEVDDDDSPYFTCRPYGSAAPGDGPPACHPETGRQAVGDASVSATSSDVSIMDEPTFSLPQLDVIVLPGTVGQGIASTRAMTRAAETRGPPTQAGRFVRPPPRAPPLS